MQLHMICPSKAIAYEDIRPPLKVALVYNHLKAKRNGRAYLLVEPNSKADRFNPGEGYFLEALQPYGGPPKTTFVDESVRVFCQVLDRLLRRLYPTSSYSQPNGDLEFLLDQVAGTTLDNLFEGRNALTHAEQEIRADAKHLLQRLKDQMADNEN